MWKLVKAILKMGIPILYNYLFFFIRWSKHPERTPVEVRYGRLHRLCVKVAKAFPIDYKKEGFEHLKALEEKDTKALIVSNHFSMFDIVLLLAICEKPISFVGKKEIEKMPIIKRILPMLEGQFLDRDNLRQGIQVIKAVEANIRSGKYSVVIFPEGTRNKDPQSDLPEFHPGTFKPAFRLDCPVLPISLFGTHRMLHTKEKGKRFPIEIAIHAPVFAKDYPEGTTEMALKVHDIIALDVHRFRDVDDKEFYEKGYEKIPLRKGSVR